MLACFYTSVCSSLVCSFTLHLNLPCMLVLQVRYYFLLSLLPLKHFCPASGLHFTVGDLFVAVDPPVPSLCPISYHCMPILPYTTSRVSISEGLCSHARLVFLALCHILYPGLHKKKCGQQAEGDDYLYPVFTRPDLEYCIPLCDL